MNHKRLPRLAALSVPILGCLFSQVEAANTAAINALTVFNRFNVVVGDYNAGNETEGAAFVYGSYTPSIGRFGFNGGQASNDSEYMLWLNDGVANNSTTQMQSGSVLSRVSVSSSLFQLNGNAPGTPVITIGESAWSNAIQNEVGLNSALDVVSTMSGASLHWAGLAANSTVSLPGNGGLAFNASPQDFGGSQVAIFNVTAEELMSGAFSRFDLSLNGADSVLINVSGSSISIQKHLTGDFVGNQSKILFNFFQADTVTLDTEFNGGLLAPNAAVEQWANINGSVVAAALDQHAEVHAYNFTGFLPAPEPSSAALGLLGVGLTMVRRRR